MSLIFQSIRKQLVCLRIRKVVFKSADKLLTDQINEELSDRESYLSSCFAHVEYANLSY